MNLAKTDCAVPRGQPRVEKWLGGLLQRCLLGSNLLGRSWGCSWGEVGRWWLSKSCPCPRAPE